MRKRQQAGNFLLHNVMKRRHLDVRGLEIATIVLSRAALKHFSLAQCPVICLCFNLRVIFDL